METNSKGFQEYPFIVERAGIWREIVAFISADLGPIEKILEIGAGYCDFINSYPAQKRMCFELNPEREKFAAVDVDFRCGDAVSLMKMLEVKVDVIFASNFFEHLSEQQHAELMPKIHDALVENGRLVLLQPNYRLCSKHYFDDETHQTIFSDKNIQLFLQKYGFQTLKIVPGLLPFSMKSRLPKWPLLVRLYLRSPIRPNAAQMYVVAQKR
jgi:SAM-dependent methyltransferase